MEEDGDFRPAQVTESVNGSGDFPGRLRGQQFEGCISLTATSGVVSSCVGESRPQWREGDNNETARGREPFPIKALEAVLPAAALKGLEYYGVARFCCSAIGQGCPPERELGRCSD